MANQMALHCFPCSTDCTMTTAPVVLVLNCCNMQHTSQLLVAYSCGFVCLS